jgi:hypothetical protein
MVDLGNSPLCESFLTADELNEAEPYYPLHVRVCSRCWLAQLPTVVPPSEIFGEYAYFSAYSDSWVEHARAYVEMIVERLALDTHSLVVELASNDGYLLQHFLPRSIPVLGVDPASNVARDAELRGVPTVVAFFGADLAERMVSERGRAALVIGNNVLAQVPDLHDFLAGTAILLDHDGTATFEFPHLSRLLDGLQYDTIYHEHFSYFSLYSISEALKAHRLLVVDVDELPTHGGSLRVYVQHCSGERNSSDAVRRILRREKDAGLLAADCYRRFSDDVAEARLSLLGCLINLKHAGNRIAGYGAPGKGNTLLNYCGIRTDLLEYTVDRNPYKHNKYTPGTHIPIHPTERIAQTRPDVILILPWNLAHEISGQLSYTAAWGATLLLPVPESTIVMPNGVSGLKSQ